VKKSSSFLLLAFIQNRLTQNTNVIYIFSEPTVLDASALSHFEKMNNLASTPAPIPAPRATATLIQSPALPKKITDVDATTLTPHTKDHMAPSFPVPKPILGMLGN
jgi:hypothetical protein